MNVPHAKVLAFVGVGALLLLSLSVAPAIAATKTLDVRTQNLTFSFAVSFLLCGSSAATVIFHIGQFSFAFWNNGHVELAGSETGRFEDRAGELIAQASEAVHAVDGTGNLPLSFQFNDVAPCTTASATPGKLVNFHFGFTIGEDGMPKEFHFVLN